MTKKKRRTNNLPIFRTSKGKVLANDKARNIIAHIVSRIHTRSTDAA